MVLSSRMVVATILIAIILALPSLVFIPKGSAETRPQGIVYGIPIAITNSQPIATAVPFQQMITVDSSQYSSYEAPNLQNVEFYYSDGSIIPSWLESGASSTSTETIYWLNIAKGIPAGSSITVYMGFGSESTSLFNTKTTGEAPQLSPTYGEYDDGPTVFPTLYQNFAGTIIPAGWVTFSANPTVDNGVTVGSSTSLGTSGSFGDNPNQILDWYAAETNPSSTGGGTGLGYQDGSFSAGISYNAVVWAWNVNGIHAFVPFINNAGSGTTYGNSASGAHVWTIYYSASTVWYEDYTQIASAISNIPTTASHVIISNGGNSQSLSSYWVRIRAHPPNGVMPMVSVNGKVGQTAAGSTSVQRATTSQTESFSESASTTTVVISAPPYVFNGAYATYETSGSGTIRYDISSVNSEAQSFDVTETYSKTNSGTTMTISLANNVPATFAQPSPFLSVSEAVLVSLNQGVVPPGLSANSVTSGVSITIRAGTFVADQVSMSDGTIWVDSNSGLIVKESGALVGATVPGSGATTLQLEKTNILSSAKSASNTLLYVAAVVIVAVVAVGVFASIRRRNKGRTSVAQIQESRVLEKPSISPEAAQKIEKLRQMLDSGLITQSDYDNETKKLRGDPVQS